MGPKLGFWSSGIEVKTTGFSATDQLSQQGMAFGFNLGGFAGVAPNIALGALMSYQMTFLAQSCARGANAGIEGCDSSGFVPQFLSFNLAVLM